MTTAAALESIWSMGARTVQQAVAESGLSRDMLWSLMDDGTLAWKAHGGRGTRLIAWRSIVEYLESLPEPEARRAVKN